MEGCAMEAGVAVRRCPFLGQLAARQGEAYAQRLAANPFARAAGPVLEEEGLSVSDATLRMWHGPGGVCPLARFSGPRAAEAPMARTTGCPFRATAAAEAAAAQVQPAAAPSSTAARPAACGATAVAAAPGHPLGRSPFASISISGFGFMPDPGQFFNRPPRAKKQQPQQRKPADPSSTKSSSGRGGGGSGAARTGAPTTSSSPSVPSSSSSSSGSARLRPSSGSSHGGAHWKQVLGGLIPLATGGRHLACPAPIVKMRATIAALKPVRDLRPQALPIRALAMSGVAISAGLPCGAWREHTRKFSPQWFLAVHATIPFVAMLRKAVLMPRWAILLTVLGSVAGQAVGARMERERLRQLSTRQALPASSASTGGSMRATAQLQPCDLVMPGLDAGCRRALQAAQSAVVWTLAPVVVQ